MNEKNLVDLVLGDGAYAAGALCDQLPIGQAGAGVAYVWDVERSRTPLMVRAPWCSDITIRRVLESVPRRAVRATGDVKDEQVYSGNPKQGAV